MNEQELRALVRDAVARHLGSGEFRPRSSEPRNLGAPEPRNPGTPEPWRHASHSLYLLVNDTDACIIEPSVPCEHCGYCKTHGH